MAQQAKDTRRRERPKVALKVGDTIEVLSGKDKGQRGKITEVDTHRQMVRVSGVNIVTKHQRQGGRSQTMQKQAGLIKMPGLVHVSNVMLVCGTCGKRTRPRCEMGGADKQRVCRQCGAEIPRQQVEE